MQCGALAGAGVVSGGAEMHRNSSQRSAASSSSSNDPPWWLRKPNGTSSPRSDAAKPSRLTQAQEWTRSRRERAARTSVINNSTRSSTQRDACTQQKGGRQGVETACWVPLPVLVQDSMGSRSDGGMMGSGSDAGLTSRSHSENVLSLRDDSGASIVNNKTLPSLTDF